MTPGPSLIGSCVRKTRYPTEDVATRVAARCHQSRGDALRAYWCSFCLGWHLTKWGAEPAGEVPAPAVVATRHDRAVARREAKRAERQAAGIRQAVALLERNGFVVIPPEAT